MLDTYVQPDVSLKDWPLIQQDRLAELWRGAGACAFASPGPMGGLKASAHRQVQACAPTHACEHVLVLGWQPDYSADMATWHRFGPKVVLVLRLRRWVEEAVLDGQDPIMSLRTACLARRRVHRPVLALGVLRCWCRVGPMTTRM